MGLVDTTMSGRFPSDTDSCIVSRAVSSKPGCEWIVSCILTIDRGVLSVHVVNLGHTPIRLSRGTRISHMAPFILESSAAWKMRRLNLLKV